MLWQTSNDPGYQHYYEVINSQHEEPGFQGYLQNIGIYRARIGEREDDDSKRRVADDELTEAKTANGLRA